MAIFIPTGLRWLVTSEDCKGETNLPCKACWTCSVDFQMEISMFETWLEPETGAGSRRHKVIGVWPVALLLATVGVFLISFKLSKVILTSGTKLTLICHMKKRKATDYLHLKK